MDNFEIDTDIQGQDFVLDFDMQRFGGGKGSSVQTVELSPEQKAIIAAGIPAAQEGGKLSADLIKQFGSNFGNLGTYSPDWNSVANNANSAYSDLNSQASDLANGKINQNILDNQTKTMKTQYDNTLGNAVNNLGKRGVVNSSVTNSAFKNIGDSFANASAANFTNNLNTSSNLLSNQSAILNNYLGTLGNLQNNSYLKQDKLYGYATGAPYTTSANNATNTANSQQSFIEQGGGGFLGGLMSGVGSYFGAKK